MSIKNDLYSTHYDVYILYESPNERKKIKKCNVLMFKKVQK